jgi:ComF family protein
LSRKSVWPFRLYQWIWFGLDAIFPPECGGCEAQGTRWCTECRKSVIPVSEPSCVICGLPQADNGICEKCQTTRPPFRALRSWVVFDGSIRNVLHRVKYQQDMGLGEPMALELANLLGPLNWPVDMIVPVPLSKERFLERGYNQVAIIAFPLSLAMDVAYVSPALRKVKHTESQVGLSADERRENVRDVFKADAHLVAGRSILLMDDVATTGSTLAEASRALMDAGAKEVYALTLARALPHHDLQMV